MTTQWIVEGLHDRITSLERQRAKLRDERDSYAKERDALVKALTETEDKRDRLREELEQSRQDDSEWKATISRLNDERDRLQERVEQLEQWADDKAYAERRWADTVDECARLQKDLHATYETNDRLRAQSKQWEIEWNEAIRERDRLRADAESFRRLCGAPLDTPVAEHIRRNLGAVAKTNWREGEA